MLPRAAWVDDTQCGLKAFSASAAQQIFSCTRIDGFAFDVEVLALAHRAGLAVTQLPVDIQYPAGSTVRLVAHSAQMAADLWRIRRHTVRR